jgi:hypothetical protein
MIEHAAGLKMHPNGLFESNKFEGKSGFGITVRGDHINKQF